MLRLRLTLRVRTSLSKALALSVDGVLTRAALHAAGVDGGVGDRMVAAGEWTKLAPSTWCTGVEPPNDRQLVRAARSHAGPDAVVTGAVACREHGLVYAPQEQVVEVLIEPGTRVVSSPYIVVHQTSRLPQAVLLDGTTYAPVVRASIDAARRTNDLRASRALLLGAVCSRRCTAAELETELEAGHSRGPAWCGEQWRTRTPVRGPRRRRRPPTSSATRSAAAGSRPSC